MAQRPASQTIRIALIVAAALAVTACNTVRGVGADIESAGEAVQRSTN